MPTPKPPAFNLKPQNLKIENPKPQKTANPQTLKTLFLNRDWSMKRLEAFECREYKAPWYFRNKHVNTIVGALLATPQVKNPIPQTPNPKP